MVSATIHLANRDWDALIDDFVALGFLPRGCDRGGCAAYAFRMPAGAVQIQVQGPGRPRPASCLCLPPTTYHPSPHRLVFPLILPAAVIIPVMDRILGPYLRGGGAQAFKSNFSALSTDLLVRGNDDLCSCLGMGRACRAARRLLLATNVVGSCSSGLCPTCLPA